MIEVTSTQFLKQLLPIDVGPDGIVTAPLHVDTSTIILLRITTEFCCCNVVKNGVLLKALSPILVTDGGMVTFTKDVQLLKHEGPMVVVPSGTITDVKDVQLLKAFESNRVKAVGNVIVVKPVP